MLLDLKMIEIQLNVKPCNECASQDSTSSANGMAKAPAKDDAHLEDMKKIDQKVEM